MKLTLIYFLCVGSFLELNFKNHLAMQKVNINLEMNDNVIRNIDSFCVWVELTNISGNIVEFDESALVGFEIFGVNNTYNLKSRYDFVPGKKVDIKPNEKIRFRIDIAELWKDHKPSENGNYRITLKFQVENEIYENNEQLVRLSI